MSVNDMREHYKNAGHYFDLANKAQDSRTRGYYQQAAEKEHIKAYEATDKAKQDVMTKACWDAKEYYDKAAEAYEKGDMKAYQNYNDQGHKIMAEAKEKQTEIQKEADMAEAETRSKSEDLQRGRYH